MSNGILKKIRYSCYIDSLVKIDEETYDFCDNCLLADTVRDDILGREICPLDVKRDIRVLR